MLPASVTGMWRIGRLAVLVVALLAIAPAPALAGWEPLGGPANGDNAEGDPAFFPALADNGGVPHVAWSAAGTAQVGFWSEGQWTRLDYFQHVNAPAQGRVDLVGFDGAIHVAWSEQPPEGNFEIHVARYQAGAWTDVGGVVSDPSDDATAPSLARCGTTLCIGYSQRTHETQDETTVERHRIVVRALNGSSWQQVGDALSFEPDGHATNPSIVVQGSSQNVAWVESDDPGAAGRIHTATFNGSSWTLRDDADHPVMRSPDGVTNEVGQMMQGNGVPYLAWVEATPTPEEDDDPAATDSAVRVARLDLNGYWVPAASGAPVDSGEGFALQADIADVGGVPHVAYTQTDAGGDNGDLHVKRLSSGGASWRELRGTAPIERGSGIPRDPDIEGIAGQAHVAWSEFMGDAGWDVFVSAFHSDLANSQPPAISGTPSPGNEVTCAPGTWSHDPSFEFIWERAPRSTTAADDPAWIAIDGASGPTYAVQADDVGSNVRCRVIATAAPDVEEAVSNVLRADKGPPLNTKPPHVNGAPIASQELSCDPGAWDTAAEFEYRWLRDGEEIANYAKQTYVVNPRHFATPGDAGKEITCRVIARNDLGSTSASSDNSLLAVEGPPINRVPPKVVVHLPQPNMANVGAVCEPGTWTDDYAATGRDGHQYEYQWLRNGELITGAVSQTYYIAIEDLGSDLQCRVSTGNPAGRSYERDSEKYFVPLPAVTSKGRMISAQGKNQFVPTNLMAIGAEYDQAVKDYTYQQLLRAVDVENARCRQEWWSTRLEKMGGPLQGNAFLVAYTPRTRCRILWYHRQDVNVRSDGVWLAKFINGKYRERDMGIGIAPVDPAKALPLEETLRLRVEKVTPTQVLWDVDDDGRTDATCPGSAPVLRSLLERGDWNPRAIVVYPDSLDTGVFSEARFENGRVLENPPGITNLPTGRLRSGQPFACRTSIEQPPEPKSGPCITEARMGRVHVTGNLCPISVRAMTQNEINYLKTNDNELYELLAEMARAVKDEPEAPAARRRAVVEPAMTPELLPRQFIDIPSIPGVPNAPGVPKLPSVPSTGSIGATLANSASSYASFKPDGVLPPGLEPPAIPKAVTDKVASLKKESAQFAMDQMYVAREKLKVNGVDFIPNVPDPSLLVPSDAQHALESVKEMKLAIADSKKQLGNLVLDANGRLRQEVDDKIKQGRAQLIKGSLDKIKDAAKNLKFGPFKWSGDMDVKLEDDGTATLKATASIPFLTGTPGGGGLTTKATLRGDINGNISLDGFTLKADTAYLGAMKVKDLDLRYDNGIGVHGKIVFPFPPANPAIVIHNFELGPDGQFRALDVEYESGPGTGIAVGPGIFLTSLRAGYNDPLKKLNGGAGISVGPSPGGGCPTIGVKATFDVVFQEVVSFDGTGNIQIACIPLTTISVKADSTGYVSVAGGLDFHFGPLFLTSQMAGSVKLPNWQIEYKGEGGIRHVPIIGTLSATIQGVLGDRGLAVCGSVKVFLIGRVGAGAGVRFSNGVPPLSFDQLISNLRLFTGCDLSSWKSLPARVRAAQAGGGMSFDVPAGKLGMGWSFQGAGDAPRVRLHSPSGKLYEFGDATEGKEVEGAFGTVIDEEDRTVVLIGKPEAGRWTVEPVEGSPPVARMEKADILPPAKVTGTVGGIGSSRVLRYRIPKIDGQVVRLMEQANGALKTLRTVRGGGGGTVRFQTSEAKGTRRQIVAQVVQDGLPRDNVVVATFNAPSPKVARPRGLRLRRRGTKVVVSWRRAALALAYDVRADVSDGQKLLLSPSGKRTKVTVRRVGRRESVRVRVVGISRAGRRGPVATKRLKAVPRRPAKRRRR